MRTAAIGFLIAFVSVFLYSEVGFAFSENEISESNDYCLIVKGADLNLTKTKDSIPIRLNSESIICFIFYTEQTLHLSYILQAENCHSTNKNSDIYLYGCTFLI